MGGRRWSIPSLDLDLVLAGLAAGVLILAVLVLPGTAVWGSTLAGASTAALASDLAAGAGLVIAGLLLRQSRDDRALATLAFLAGIAWLAADIAGWHDGPAVVRVTAAIAAAALAPLLLHLSAAAPTGQLMSRAATVMVVLGYAVVPALAVAGALVTDPGSSVLCWRDCRSNPFLVADLPQLAIALRDGLAMATLCCGIAIASIALARLARASAPARSRLWPLLVAGVAMGGAVAASAVRVLWDPVVRPHEALDATLFLLLAGSVAAFASALVWTVFRGRELLAALSELGGDPGDQSMDSHVRQRLVRATGDPGLSVAYRLGEPERWIDAEGIETSMPTPALGRAATPLVRGGEVIAVVSHDPSVMAPVDLEAALGPATRLAIENERLRAGILAELSALRASRGQIVATGDRERLRLERDLHDGAQQRLLALSYDLRMARAAAFADGLDSEVQQLDVLIAAARAAHVELRELAHGIYPAILAEAGLGPALETLARRADIPLDLEVDAGRADAEAENAAYAAVAAAIREASTMGATQARVVIKRRVDELLVAVIDDTASDRGVPDDLADRVGAAGGTFTVGQAAGWRRLEATIPCA